MSFSYNAGIDNNLNRLRNLIADTNSANYLFSDDELNLFITMGGDSFEAASLACLAISSNRALQAFFFSIHNEDLRIDKSQIPKYFIQLSNLYHDRATQMSVVEFMDSVDYTVDDYGQILGEMVGDDELY